MNNMPLVSVLITAYNREKYIEEAIESVLKSTYKNFELIIVDDCSTDNTFNLARAYEGKDKRVKVFVNNHNLGQFENRNKSISLSGGKFIKFLDSDDLIYPESLEKMVKSMLSYPLAGIGVHHQKALSSETVYLIPHDSILRHFNGNNHLCLGPTGTIFSKKAVEEAGCFESKYGILADTLLNLKVASLYPTVFFSENLYFWRVHKDQVTTEQEDDVRMIKERYLILKAILSYSKLPLSQKEIKKIKNNFIKINFRHFFYYLMRGKFNDAMRIKISTQLSIKALLSLITIK